MTGTPAQRLRSRLRIPVIAHRNAGIIAAMPALDPHGTAAPDEDIARIRGSVHDTPCYINLVAHRSDDRLQADPDVILRHRVPIVVLAVAADTDLVTELRAAGFLVCQHVINSRHAVKWAEMGVDGIIAVAARGQTDDLSPFALMQAIREWRDGLPILSGCIATGRAILAAEVPGADLAYGGSAFPASDEANTQAGSKQMIVDGSAAGIAVADCFTGVDANFLPPSIVAGGLDPTALRRSPGAEIDISGGRADSRARHDSRSAGQGIGAIRASGPAAYYIDRLAADHTRAQAATGMA